MLEDQHSIISQFILLWVVIEPISVTTIFLGVTAGLANELRLGIAVKAIVISAAVLLFFIVAGQFLLEALGVDLLSFQIAGAIVLFAFAMSMIFGQTDGAGDHPPPATPEGPSTDVAVFPMAIPTIAGPGTMLAVVLLTDNHRYSIVDQAVTACITAVVLLITLGFLAAAGPINRVIGVAGARVISRVMGLVLAAIAVNNVLTAITLYFGIAK